MNIPCSTFIEKTIGGKTEYYHKVGETEFKIDSLKRTGCCCNENAKLSIQASYLTDTTNWSGIERDLINNLDFDDLDKATKNEFFDKIFIKRWFASVSAAIAKTSFDYITDSFSILPVLDEKRLNKSFKLNVGYILNPDDKDKLSVLAFTFSYSPGYEASDANADISYPVGSQGLTYSKNVSIGNPNKTSNTRIALEYRKQWRVSTKFPIAISPSASYLFDKNAFSLMLPVYLFQSKKDEKFTGLQGGFKLAYKTTTVGKSLTPFAQGFGASVFISAPFDMFSF